MVRDAKAADRAYGFGEGADDEIDVIDDALCFGDAAPMLSDEAHGMRFVDQHHCPVCLGDGDHFPERRDVAQHRIDAFEHDELSGTFRNAL